MVFYGREQVYRVETPSPSNNRARQEGSNEMKSTGIVRKVDDMGRIVLPIELRRNLEIDDGTPLEIYVEGESIVLKPSKQVCIFCGSSEGVQQFKGRCVCESCREELAKD